MPPFPPLADWETSRDALHRASKLLATFQKAFSPALPNALHLALSPYQTGLHTRPLSFGGLALDFAAGEIRCTVGVDEAHFPLNEHSPKSLHAALIEHLTALGIGGTDALKPPTDDAPLVLDLAIGTDYASALWAIYTSLARVRGGWMGPVTPIVVWPHGFDLSTLYFSGQNPDEHTQPHLNFGFSPGSSGFPRPYLYAYASPMPDGAVNTPLPPLARWTTDGWRGVVIDYDALHTQDDPQAALEHTLRAVFQRMVGWAS